MLIGAICVILASTASSVGVNLQKKAQSLSPSASFIVYMVGILCMVGGASLDFVALYFLSQLQLGILGSSSLIINFIISNRGFREHISVLQMISIACLSIGIPLGAYGSHTPGSVHVIEQWNTRRTHFSLIAMHLIITGIVICARKTKHILAYGALTGLFAANLVFFAKYISLSFTSPEKLAPQLFKAIAMASVCAASHLYFYNKALEKGSATSVMPIHQCFWTMGCFYYGIFALSETLPSEYSAKMYMGMGLALCLTGLTLIVINENFIGEGHEEIKRYRGISAAEAADASPQRRASDAMSASG